MFSQPFDSIKVAPDQPIWESQSMTLWSEIAQQFAAIHYDGSSTDYRRYMQAIALFINASMDISIPTLVAPGVHLNLPPSHVEELVSNYVYRSREKHIVYFDTAMTDALLATDLKWIEADCFDALPDVVSLVIPPNPRFALHVEGVWYPVTDILLYRMLNDDQTALMEDDFPGLRRGRMFGFHAISRVEAGSGVLYSSWGTLPIKEDMKLDDLLSGLGSWAESTRERSLRSIDEIGPMEAISLIPGEAGRFQEDYLARISRDYVRDMAEHGKEHQESCLNVVGFLAKFALLRAAEKWESYVRPLPVPGVKQKTKLSKKAAEIQGRARARWGTRYRLVFTGMQVVDGDAAALEAHGGHASPVRHLVMGFFRQQPYGPQRSLRKTIWIEPFWRGRNEL